MKKQQAFNLLFAAQTAFLINTAAVPVTSANTVDATIEAPDNYQLQPGAHCEIDRCEIGIHPRLSIEASADDFHDEGNGQYTMVGDLTLNTPTGNVDLLDAELVFNANPDGSEIAYEVYGIARAPFGSIPLLGNGGPGPQPLAAVGLVSRATLQSLMGTEDEPIPLARNPKDPNGDPNDLKEPAYLFFHFDAGISFDIPLNPILGIEDDTGGFGFSVPGDRSLTLVLDPEEPYFYLSSAAVIDFAASMQEALEWAREANQTPTDSDNPDADDSNRTDSDPNRVDAGDLADSIPLPELHQLAFSAEGGIPLSPETLWGLPDVVDEFKGHLYFNASVPLYKFIELDGEVVTAIDENGYTQVGNGNVSVNFDLIPGVLSFSFDLGQASAGVSIGGEEQAGFFSGIKSADTSFLPAWIPIVPTNETMISGYISSQYPELTRLNARGQFGYSPQALSSLIGVSLNDLAMSQAQMSISIDGITLSGKTDSSIHPSIQLGTAANVEIFFPFRNPADASIKMSGEMLVLGTGLSPAALEISKQGFYVDGKFITPLSEIGLSGQIAHDGPALEGLTNVQLPLDQITRSLNEAQEKVAAARAEVNRLQGLVDAQIKIVVDRRAEHARKLQIAQDALTAAQTEVNGLSSAISYQYKLIKKYRAQIASKYSWYKSQPWYKKAWAWTEYTAYKTYKYGQITLAYSKITALNVAKTAAVLALEAAKIVLATLEKATETIPVELDPIVASLIVSKDAARLVLLAAEEVLKRIPVIDANFGAEILIQLNPQGLRGDVSVSLNDNDLLGGTLSFDPVPKVCVELPAVGSICTPF